MVNNPMLYSWLMLAGSGDLLKAKNELRNSENFISPIYWGALVMIEGQ